MTIFSTLFNVLLIRISASVSTFKPFLVTNGAEGNSLNKEDLDSNPFDRLLIENIYYITLNIIITLP